jgi:hypothetical protein
MVRDNNPSIKFEIDNFERFGILDQKGSVHDAWHEGSFIGNGDLPNHSMQQTRAGAAICFRASRVPFAFFSAFPKAISLFRKEASVIQAPSGKNNS